MKLKEEVIVNTKTQKEYDTLIKRLEREGYDTFTANIWVADKSKTGVGIKVRGKFCSWSDIDYYKDNYSHIPIITLKQFLGGKMSKQKKIKFVVGWDEGCGDPYAEFTTKTAMEKKVKELMEASDCSNIKVYEIKKKFEVENNPKLKEVK